MNQNLDGHDKHQWRLNDRAVRSATEYRAVPMPELRFPTLVEAGLSGDERSRTTESVVARYVAARAEFAFSSAYLEGNSFTLPEVRALLRGTIPAAKPTHDVDQILDLLDAADVVEEWADDHGFAWTFERGDQLNSILARHEAIDAGVRRINSRINDDGRGATVNVKGDIFIGLNKSALAAAEGVLRQRIEAIEHPVLRATTFAAALAYMQPYMDGNKRTGRYLMDAELMSHGYDAIAIPASRADEYQEALAQMFRTADTTAYVKFLVDVWNRAQV